MADYYVDTDESQPSRTHLVHRYDCARLPPADRLLFVDDVSDGEAAVQAARLYYLRVCACDYCCAALLVRAPIMASLAGEAIPQQNAPLRD